MPRIRQVNKVPKTTVALSDELIRKMLTYKPHRESWDVFINRVFHQWIIAEEKIKDYEAIIEYRSRQQQQTINDFTLKQT